MIDFLYIVIYTFIEGCDYLWKQLKSLKMAEVKLSDFRKNTDFPLMKSLSSLDEFTDDFMADGRYTVKTDKRENL